MKKLIGVLLKIVSAITVVLMLALAILVFFGITVNLEFMRGGVETAASRALDREVRIEGPVELEFSNWPALNISDVKVANVEGGIQDKLLNAGFVRMQIGVFPLLRGEINIADISADDVTLNLESDAAGQPNWVFARADKDVASASAATEPGTADEPEVPAKDGEARHIQFTALSHLSLQRIAVNYHDAALEKSLSFVLESMQGSAAEGQPIGLKLNGRVQERDYKLALDGGSIEDLFDKDTAWGFRTDGEVFGKQVAGEGKLSLRGVHPEVRLALGARDLDVGAILAALGLVEGMQASLGDVGMEITLKGDSLHEVLSQSSMAFVVKQGNWKVTVPNTQASFDINDLNGKISVQEGNNISMALDGSIEAVPVKLLITGAPLVDYVTDQTELPLSIDAEMLQSKLVFDSHIKLPVSATDMSFALTLSTPQLDYFNGLLKIELPSVGPVSLESKLDIKPREYDLSALSLTVGESRLEGGLKLDLSQTKPRLDAFLVSEQLQMDDFRTAALKQAAESDAEGEKQESAAESDEVEEAPKRGEGKRLLSHEVLNAFDADIRIAAEQVLSGEDKLGSAEVVLALEDAHLQLEPITLEIPGGRFDASVGYTPSPDDIRLQLRADVEDFDVGVLIRHLKPGSDMGGRLYLDVSLDAAAPDPSLIMANASGKLDFGLVPENFSSGIIDLWAVNLLSAIMDKSTEKDQAEINCVVVRTRVDEGILAEEAIYLDTSNMRIAGKMDIDFISRELEIKLAPRAKRPEFFSVAIPIQVKGSLDDFGLKIGALRMAGQVVSFITSPIHVPIRRVFTEDSPQDGVEACTYAWTVTDSDEDKPR